MSRPFALDNLNCGYCRAPLVDHDLIALKICNHRMTEALATAGERIIDEVRDLIEAKQVEAANDMLAALESLIKKQK